MLIEAQNLEPDMILIDCKYPIIDTEKELKYPYIYGYYYDNLHHDNNA